MKKLSFLLFAIFFAGFLACQGENSNPAAINPDEDVNLAKANIVVRINQKIPMTDVTVNPCNGEIVDISGILHLSGQVVDDPSGGRHITLHISWQNLSGVGQTTRLQYQLQQNTNINVNGNGQPSGNSTGAGFNPPFVHNVSENVRWVSQGSTDNFFTQTNYHITVGPNGVVTANYFNSNAECRG